MSSGTERSRSRNAFMAPTAVMLLTAKIAVGSGVEGEHLLGGSVAADLVDGRSEDEIVAVGQPGGGEGLAIALQPLAAGGGVLGVGEVRDVAVPDREQVLDEAARARDAVADHEVAVGVWQGAVEQHEREAAAQQRKDAVARRVARRRQQQALDPVRHQILDVFALEPEVAFAVAEQHAVAGAPGRGFGAAHDRREERVDHVGNDEADGLGLLRQEPAGDAVRDVVERRRSPPRPCAGSRRRRRPGR